MSQPVLEPTGAMKSFSLRPGTHVLHGRFRVLELLGRGGMGDVYLAEQISLGRKVALKTLREDLSLQPGMTERFKREARLLSAVDHPSVVRVIDFGEADGAYILVMEFVEGENLGSELRRGPLEPARAILMLKGVAEGLAAIHAQGIVHRDLKADNVLVARDASGERARLLDFGIAKLAEAEGPGAAMTQAGLVLGTPEYLSPEQATGGKVDAKSDVYAFGILGFRLLAGRNPFEGPSAREFLLQHIATPPPLLQTVAPQLAAHPALTALVMSCLSKDPAARPKDGKALLEALAALEAGAPPAIAATIPMRGLSERSPAVPPPTGAPAVDQTASAGAPALPAAAARRVTQRIGRLSRHVRLGAIAAVAALVLSLGAWLVLTRDSTGAKVRALLDQGRSTAALELLDASKQARDPELRLLRAEAFHQLKRHREEWDIVAVTPFEILEWIHPAALSGLLEDFAKSEREEPLRSALSKLSPEGMRALAKGPLSLASWGSVRYLDIWRVTNVDLVPLYVAALESNDCEICGIAAKRLGELGDQRAVAPLEKLKSSPRKAGFLFFTQSCGHDEADASLRKLSPREPE